ncbi:MAG: c-type cytochrome [Betaproteobacteria bacterium]
MKAIWVALGTICAALFVAGTASAQLSARLEGKNMFRQYCATCHGLDGKGHGPTADSLKKAPADLTMIQEAGKKFPGERVAHAIEGTGEGGPHGTREMPVWGQVFRYTKNTPPVPLAVQRLVEYIATIQVNK